MTPDRAKSLMETVMISARADIAHDLLSAYMRGYYVGALFAYANVSGSEDVRALGRLYSEEVRNANKEPA